ncbi:MAG: GTP pyrophosphokinase family protein [Bacillota bacterium]|nr:GTP pyrophosphokinase family protein [Bacillota bacterium]
MRDVLTEKNINSLGKGANIFLHMHKFEEFMMMYSCAMKEVKTKFEILKDDMTVRHNRNPIEAIKTRLKRPESIYDKLKRLGCEISVQSVIENINDVAGVRVICSFVDDIYEIADIFSKQDDITVLKIKDYIKNPKPNGYRSYHMIVEIPVFFADHKRPMKVEVQFRTIAMDFWASLEHKMKYKCGIPETQGIMNELKECADVIFEADRKMLMIREKVEKSEKLTGKKEINFTA